MMPPLSMHNVSIRCAPWWARVSARAGAIPFGGPPRGPGCAPAPSCDPLPGISGEGRAPAPAVIRSPLPLRFRQLRRHLRRVAQAEDVFVVAEQQLLVVAQEQAAAALHIVGGCGD